MSFTESSMDMLALCHGGLLASTRGWSHAPAVLDPTGRRFSPFAAFVAGTFALGWACGLVLILKVWHLAAAPRWMIFSGVGYVSLVLGPAVLGFVLARLMGRLASRGFGGAPLGLLGLGVVGLVVGIWAL
jgi:hypothetical protein